MKKKFLYLSVLAITTVTTVFGTNIKDVKAVALSGDTSTIVSASSGQLQLPSLRGSYSVGTTSYKFTDSKRQELFDPSGAGGHRQLGVQVWYPGQAVPSATSKSYVDPSGVPFISQFSGIPEDILNSIRPNAFSNIPVAEGARYPVVFLSPGSAGGFLEQYTAQAEELASHGYLVVGMSHTYESLITVFADNQQVIPANSELLAKLNKQPENIEELFEILELRKQLVDVRRADASFILDQLVELNNYDPQGVLAGVLDLDNVGIYGHSLGGIAVTEVLRSDSRFKAGLSLDSDPLLDFGEGIIPEGIDQPYMVISDPHSPNYLDLDKFWASLNLKNDGYSVTLAGMQHEDFSDLPLLAELIANGVLDPLNPHLGTQAVNAYNRAFFDRYLKNIDSPLLNGVLPDGMTQDDVAFVSTQPVPEPSSFGGALLAGGILFYFRKQRSMKKVCS